MVKTEIFGHIPGVEERNIFCVIGSDRGAASVSQKDNADRVFARVATGVGIDMKLLDKGHCQLSFFLGLADGSGFNGFAIIDKAARNGPAKGLVVALDQHNGAMGAIA